MTDTLPPPVEVIDEPLSAEEKAELLGRVEEIQTHRAGARLSAEEVPGVLLPYQAAWHRDASGVRIAIKSRRIGFSWGCLAAEAVLEAGMTHAAGGMDQFYMGYNKDMAAEFIGDCAFFARAYAAALGTAAFRAGQIAVSRQVVLIDNERRDIIKYSVRLASGHKIEALSSNPHNWRGRQGHARIDEAAFHDGLREVIKGALAFRMWGGRVDVVSTHNGDESEFAQLLKEVEAGKLPWSRHAVTFDDALHQGFYRRVCLTQGWEWSEAGEAQYRAATYADYPNAEDAAEELDCAPKRGSGVYIPRALIEKCWEKGIPVLAFSKPATYVLDDDRAVVARTWISEHLVPVLEGLDATRRHVFGQDFGRDGDLSVIWVLAEDGPARWRVALSVEMRRIPFDIQKLILFTVIDGLPHFARGALDARGNGQSHAEAAQQKYGPSRILCIKATVQWYAEWFPKYKQAYVDRAITVPMAEDIATDHRRVVLVGGSPTMDPGKDKGSDGGSRHGDSAIAGLLAWAAANQDGEPAAGETVDTPPPREALAKHGMSRGGMAGLGSMAAALARPALAMFGRGR